VNCAWYGGSDGCTDDVEKGKGGDFSAGTFCFLVSVTLGAIWRVLLVGDILWLSCACISWGRVGDCRAELSRDW